MTGAPGTAQRVPQARHLFVARLVEQASLGVGSLVLAGVLGAERFAPISLLVVINSFAVVASDFGLGLAIMRQAPGKTVAWRTMHLLRGVNLGIAVAACALGAALGGTAGWIVALSGLMWSTSAEAYVRKSAAMRLLEERSVALSEGIGAIAFLGVTLSAIAWPDQALPITGLAFLVKQVLESVLVRGWRPQFTPDGEEPRPWALLGTQVLSFGIRDIDFLIVGMVFTPTAFSIYVLAWRTANLLPAQMARVASRVAMVGFAENPDDRQVLYDRYVRNLFLIGVAGGAVTAACAPLLPVVLDDSWAPAVGVIVVLCLAVPFRTVIGIMAALALNAEVEKRLMAWEVGRLVVTTAALLLVSPLGFPAVVVAATVTSILPTTAYNIVFARRAGLRPARFVLAASVAACVLAVAGAALLSTPT